MAANLETSNEEEVVALMWIDKLLQLEAVNVLYTSIFTILFGGIFWIFQNSRPLDWYLTYFIFTLWLSDFICVVPFRVCLVR